MGSLEFPETEDVGGGIAIIQWNLGERNRAKVDFLSLFCEFNLTYLAENVLSYLDERTVCYCEKVCSKWREVIIYCKVWKRLAKNRASNDIMWDLVLARRDRLQYLTHKYSDDSHEDHLFYKSLYEQAKRDVKMMDVYWLNKSYRKRVIKTGVEVCSLQYNNKTIVVGCEDGALKLYDREMLQHQKTLEGHRASVFYLQMNEKSIISLDDEGGCHVWDIEAGKGKQLEKRQDYSLKSLKLKGNNFVCCHSDGQLEKWHFDAPSQVRCIFSVHFDIHSVTQLELNGNYTFCGSETGDIVVLRNLKYNALLSGHTGAVIGLECHGDLLISISVDDTYRFWSVSEGECLKSMTSDSGICSVRLDEKRIVTITEDGSITVWNRKTVIDIKKDAPVANVDKYTRAFIVEMDHYSIITATTDNKIVLYDFTHRITPRAFRSRGGFLSRTSSCTFI